MIQVLYHVAIKDEPIPNPNNDKWRNFIIKDLRKNIFPQIDGLFKNYRDICILLYFNELGVYFGVFRQITVSQGRPDDHHVIWVFVPYDETVSSRDLQQLLDDVINRIKAPNASTKQEQAKFSEDLERLGRNTPTTKLPNGPGFVSANNGKYACRYYCNEENTLHEIIEAGLFQQDYKNYEAVFLLDRDGGLKCKPVIDDLTSKEFTQSVIVDPDKLFDAPLPNGVELYYKDKPFKKPIYVVCGESLQITFKRDGQDGNLFLPITGTVKVGNIITLPKLEWKVRIKRELFKVRNKDKVVKEFNLIINNQRVQGDYIDVSEEAAKKAKVRIEKTGYTQISDEGDVDLLDALRRGQKVIELKKDDQEFVVNQGDFEKVRVVVTTSQTIDDDESPLDGYARRGNMLEYKSWAFIKYLPFWFMTAGALILGGVGGFYINKWLNSRSFKPKTEVTNPTQTNSSNAGQNDQNTTTPPANNDTPVAVEKNESSQNAGVEYLENHDVWNKDEMEQIAELKEFWDLVNSYSIDQMNSPEWKEKLSKSKKYNELISAFGGKSTKDFKGSSPYISKANDHNITFDGYLDTVKRLSNTKPKGDIGDDGEKDKKNGLTDGTSEGEEEESSDGRSLNNG